MGDLSPDINQTPANESKRSIFDSYKFWGRGSRHRRSLNIDIENSPIKMIKEDPIVDSKENSIVDIKLDSNEDSNHDSIVELKLDSNEDPKQDSIVDLKLDSNEDSKQDSIVDLKLDSNEDSKEDSKQDSKKNSIVDINENTPKQEFEQPDPSTLSLRETISGNSIITRGWDGNNMSIYKTRRKML